MRPAGVFSPKTWQERGVNNTQKTITRKVRVHVEKLVKNEVPKSDSFDFFGVSGRRRPRVVPRIPKSTVQGEKILKIVYERCAQTTGQGKM